MIQDGAKTMLSREQQFTLARWAVKTAMVFEFTNAAAPSYTFDDRNALRNGRLYEPDDDTEDRVALSSLRRGVRRNRGSAAEVDRVQVPSLRTSLALGRSTAGALLMDFDPYSSHWRENVPPMTLLEACWQMTSPRGRVLNVCCVPDDRRPRGAMRVLRRRPHSITIRARTRNGSRDCRWLEDGRGSEGLFGSY